MEVLLVLLMVFTGPLVFIICRKKPVEVSEARMIADWQELHDKGWGYNVATAGKQHLADALMDKMLRMPSDIAEAWCS
jgi:hypothetical protein